MDRVNEGVFLFLVLDNCPIQGKLHQEFTSKNQTWYFIYASSLSFTFKPPKVSVSQLNIKGSELSFSMAFD
jgi:hypothetical protein